MGEVIAKVDRAIKFAVEKIKDECLKVTKTTVIETS